MNTTILRFSRFASVAVLANFLVAQAPAQSTDPQINSWLTSYSGKYARIYATAADATSGNAVSTWTRSPLSQSSPAYCGVQELYYSSSWVYLRSTGLGIHTMGPWYLNAARTTLFP